jgi:hypothetical protein
METLDLSAFDTRARAQEGVDMPLLDPAGFATRAVLRVRGMDSQVYQDALTKFVRAGAERGRKRTSEERDAEFLEVQATLVAGWSVDGKPAALVFEKDGKPLECTPANVARVLREHAWVLAQVIAFAERRQNFLPGSASS